MLKFIVNKNVSKDKVPESFTGDLAQHLSKALDKPAQYLAIQISPDQGMSLSGSTDSCAVCFPYSTGRIGEQENKVYCMSCCRNTLVSWQHSALSNERCLSSLSESVSASSTSVLANVNWNNIFI